MRLTCRAVVVETGCATQSSLSFSIPRDNQGEFWVDGLLYLNGDQRYQSVPQAIHLSNEGEGDNWFLFISGALREYGGELFRATPGAFDRLPYTQSHVMPSMRQR
jgi:hypothetical protein